MVVVKPPKCRWFLPMALVGCDEPVRNAPGAVYCEQHRYLENAGCAEHDKVNCKHRECAP